MSIPREVREEVLERDQFACQYCMKAGAQHIDHLIPIALRRRHHIGECDPEFLTSACARCNWLKGTSKLVPKSRQHMIPLLPSTGWMVWDGSMATLRKPR